jgi:hypothetical protein
MALNVRIAAFEGFLVLTNIFGSLNNQYREEMLHISEYMAGVLVYWSIACCAAGDVKFNFHLS